MAAASWMHRERGCPATGLTTLDAHGADTVTKPDSGNQQGQQGQKGKQSGKVDREQSQQGHANQDPQGNKGDNQQGGQGEGHQRQGNNTRTSGKR